MNAGSPPLSLVPRESFFPKKAENDYNSLAYLQEKARDLGNTFNFGKPLSVEFINEENTSEYLLPTNLTKNSD